MDSIWCFLVLLLSSIGSLQGNTPVVTLPKDDVEVVNEEIPIGSHLFYIYAYDSTPDHTLTVSTSNAIANTYVNVTIKNPGNNITVDVTSNHRLDVEALTNGNKLSLQFTVDDGHLGTIERTMELYLNDINDNPPVFSRQAYRWEIPELPWLENKSEVFNNIRATDADRNNFNTVIYAIEPNSQSEAAREEYKSTFSIDNTTGDVTLLKPLDYSKNSFYQFTVTARNPMDVVPPGEANFTTADFIISVLDRQNKPPFFTGIPYRSVISEGIEMSSSVLTVSAVDGDTGVSNPVNYTIQDGTCSSLFDILPSNGTIYTSNAIDRDSGDVATSDGVCILQILVQEIVDPTMTQYGNTSASTTVTITVSDKNDNSPRFGNTTYQAEIQENAARNIPIILNGVQDITVWDDDAERDFTTMELSLKYPNGSNCSDFTVSPLTVIKSGSVIIKVDNSELLDYESVKQLTLLVVAQESNNASHVATATVSLTLLDMNDNNPQFNNDTYTFHIQESSPDNTTVGIIQASDKDSATFGSVVYRLSGGNDRFAVDEDSGRVYTRCTHCSVELDRERVDVFYMTVTAMDMNGTSGARSDSTSLVVRLLDVNDNAPEFIRSSPIQVYIDENDAHYKDTALVQIQASDKDDPKTNNSVVRYRLGPISQPSMENNITVNNTRGEVFLTGPVDFEQLNGSMDKRSIEVVIIAYDLGEVSRESNITVIIDVQDMNDNSPVFVNQTFYGSVHENETSSPGSITYVGRANATDDDGSERNKAINYYIISGSSDRFTIDSSTGQVSIQFGATLDRETTSSYNMTIMAIDQGSPPRNATAHMIVEILDVNDELPEFNQSTYAVSIKENITEEIEKVFFHSNVTDRDTNSNLLYTIAEIRARSEKGETVDTSLVQDYFEIHSSNGSVYVMNDTDRETAETIVLTIHVEDVNAFYPKPQTATATLIVTLMDINDNRPQFTEDIYQMAVSENALDGTRLQAVIATDRDVNRTITYSITDDMPFDIDSTTGTIIKKGGLDRETNTSIQLTVFASDNGIPQLNSSATVNVTLIDFNDNAPVFVMNFTTISIQEHSDTCNETYVLVANATDADEGKNQEIKYSCPNCRPAFEINDTTGLITTKGCIDREDVPMYELQVEAKDQPVNEQEQKSTTVTVTVRVTDINDNAPQFSHLEYTANIREDIPTGTTVLTVSANDLDEQNTNNSMISYSFVGDTAPAGLFKIDAQRGHIITNASLKDQTETHVINVTATDHGDPKLSNSTVVKITVQDINSHNPVITNLPEGNLIKVFECTSLGFELHAFNYSDGDKGLNSEAYFNISKILDTDNIEVFDLRPNGSLLLKEKLNFTIQHEYKFQISVTDKGIPPLSSDKVTITVKVIDVDDHEPSFVTDHTTLHVEENKAKGALVGTVTAVDPDSDSTSCYSIVNGDWAAYFTVGNTTGTIHTTTTFDRENSSHSNIAFNITVKDCSIATNTSIACGNGTKDKDNDVINEIKVSVIIDDVNDNPPRFKDKEIVTGMRRTTEVNTILDLNLKQYVEDLDSPQHGFNVWTFRNNGSVQTGGDIDSPPDSGALPCANTKKHLFCISPNGSIISNKYFPEDKSGYFLVPVSVHDANGSDVADVKIYLIADSQILIMVILGSKEEVSEKTDDVLKLYSEITKHTFVYDGLADHKTAGGGIDPLKTDLYFHVVDPETQRILSTEEAIRLIDEYALQLQAAMRQYSVIEVVSSVPLSQEEDNKEKTIYILAAVVAVLTVTVIIIVYVAVNTRLKYQKKLKAAYTPSDDTKTIVSDNPLFVPGSNVYSKQSNPLLNSEVPVANNNHYDTRSMSSNNSLDDNDIGEIRDPNGSTRYDSFEEREARMDIFSDDSRVPKDVESPLDAALRLHSIQTAANVSNELDSTRDISEADTEETGLDTVTLSGVDNDMFEGDLESTEI